MLLPDAIGPIGMGVPVEERPVRLDRVRAAGEDPERLVAEGACLRLAELVPLWAVVVEEGEAGVDGPGAAAAALQRMAWP